MGTTPIASTLVIGTSGLFRRTTSSERFGIGPVTPMLASWAETSPWLVVKCSPGDALVVVSLERAARACVRAPLRTTCVRGGLGTMPANWFESDLIHDGCDQPRW